MDFEAQQKEICRKYGVSPFVTSEFLKVGISKNALKGALPINGLRHLPEGGTSGWYIWAGEELSQADDFFLPMHIHHLHHQLPSVIKYLLLPPGWRFLMGHSDYEDVWMDANLLDVER